MATKLAHEQIEKAKSGPSVSVVVQPVKMNVIMLGGVVTLGLFALALRRYIDLMGRVGGGPGEVELAAVFVTGATFLLLLAVAPFRLKARNTLSLSSDGVDFKSQSKTKHIDWPELDYVSLGTALGNVVLRFKSSACKIEISGTPEELGPLLKALDIPVA